MQDGSVNTSSVSKIHRVCVLGATGSIGCSTLDVIERHPDRFQAYALAAYSNDSLMLEQCLKHEPVYAVLVDEKAASRLEKILADKKISTEVLSGEEALSFVAAHDDVDIVMAAIVGAAGLTANLSAVKQGKKVLLANKESLVLSGKLFMDEVALSGATLLPIDSEHNAIFQSLPDRYRCGDPLDREVSRILLTASGGPFRNFSYQQLQEVTVEQACTHPNWSMGQKISVDSASLMNKGLELIEACWLFDVSPNVVEVHVHPESIVHSMVEYVDGSVLAQMGSPDMRTPIAYGMAWPERIESGVNRLNLFDIAQLNFEKPNTQLFPCLRLAQDAFNAGGSACAVLNAANEVAVSSFLKGNVRFTDIPDIIESTLSDSSVVKVESIEHVLELDLSARKLAAEKTAQITNRR